MCSNHPHARHPQVINGGIELVVSDDAKFPVVTYGNAKKILLRLKHEVLTGLDGTKSGHFVL
eukprot:5788846-Prorocentrum_lima.AAC.1